MSIWDNLTSLHLDVLKEIGNIGAGNAATALAEIVSRKINMSVPHAGVMSVEDFFKLAGGEEDRVACINLLVKGDAPGQILYIFTEESAYDLLDMLYGNPSHTKKDLNEMDMSALGEIGNILTGSFLTAFSQFTGLSFIPSVPGVVFDMLASAATAALLEAGYLDDKVLLIETNFFDDKTELTSYLFFLPHSGSLEKILAALGIIL